MKLEKPSQRRKTTESPWSSRLLITDISSNTSPYTMCKQSLTVTSNRCLETVQSTLPLTKLVSDTVSSVVATMPLKKTDKLYEEVKNAFYASICASFEIVQVGYCEKITVIYYMQLHICM